jgi:hypothetical protein
MPMGRQAACTLRIGRTTAVGEAFLETETLLFRGDLRLEIPLDRIRKVAVVEHDLIVLTPDQEARFELGGAVALRWARAIREPKGLFEKLELTPLSHVAVVGITDPDFLATLRERAASVAEGRVPEGTATVFLGADARPALPRIPLLRATLLDTGVLWVVRPKGSASISESEVLGAIREAGLVDTKVVAFSPTHTAHKCVIPVARRGQPGHRRVRPRPAR